MLTKLSKDENCRLLLIRILVESTLDKVQILKFCHLILATVCDHQHSL